MWRILLGDEVTFVSEDGKFDARQMQPVHDANCTRHGVDGTAAIVSAMLLNAVVLRLASSSISQKRRLYSGVAMPIFSS
jgi:hypothetical protein